MFHPSSFSYSSVAEAMTATLCEMNPLISVQALPETSLQDWEPSALTSKAMDIAIVIDRPTAEVRAANAACRRAGALFFAAGARSVFGWAFADLGASFEYALEHKAEGGDEVRRSQETVAQCSWEEAMAADLTGRRLTRIHPVYLMLRGVVYY